MSVIPIEELDAELVMWKTFDKHIMCAMDPPWGLSEKWPSTLKRLKDPVYRQKVMKLVFEEWLQYAAPISPHIQ